MFSDLLLYGVLRSSALGASRKFAIRKQRPSNTKDTPPGVRTRYPVFATVVALIGLRRGLS
jgi:hypothetical protein